MYLFISFAKRQTVDFSLTAPYCSSVAGKDWLGPKPRTGIL